MFQVETYNILSNFEEIRNWRRIWRKLALHMYATEVSVLARIRRDRLDSSFLMLVTEMMSLFANLNGYKYEYEYTPRIFPYQYQ